MPEFKFDPEKHLYTLDGVKLPSVTEVLPYNYSGDYEYQRDRGDKVHLMIDYYNKGILDEDTLDVALIPYLDAYKRFRAEHSLNGLYDIKTGQPHPCTALQLAGYYLLLNESGLIPDVLASEIRLYSAIYLFAGTIDLIKISKTPCKTYAVYLSGDGKYRLEDHTKELRKNQGIFLSFLTAHKWKGENNLWTQQ